MDITVMSLFIKKNPCPRYWIGVKTLLSILSVAIEVLLLSIRVRQRNAHVGLYSLSRRTSYRQRSWNLEAARLYVMIIVSIWNLIGISATLLPRRLSNFTAIGKISNWITRIRDFTRSYGKTSVRLVNKSHGLLKMHVMCKTLGVMPGPVLLISLAFRRISIFRCFIWCT